MQVRLAKRLGVAIWYNALLFNYGHSACNLARCESQKASHVGFETWWLLTKWLVVTHFLEIIKLEEGAMRYHLDIIVSFSNVVVFTMGSARHIDQQVIT